MPSPRTAGAPRALLALFAALLVAACWLAFAPALDAGFVNWDDRANLLENERFRGLSAEHLRWMFTTTYMGPYQPLSWLSFALDHAAGGLDPAGYHATNLALHACGTLALWALARRVLRDLALEVPAHATELGAFAAALLFAVHPLRVESVAWVTERRDVLSAPFFFLALLAWWRYARAPAGAGRRDYALALAALALSLLAKGSAIVMPALLVLLDLGPLRDAARARGTRRLVLEKLPFVAVAGAFAWIALVGQARDAALVGAELHGPATRAIQAGYNAWFHATRTLWPAELIPIHRMPPAVRLLDAAYLVPALAVLALTLVTALAWRRLGAPAWAWWAFLVTLAPVSGLAHSGPQLVAERYGYLACAPFALLAGGGLALLARRAPLAAWGGLALLAAALGWRANLQTRVWHDSWSLWAHTLRIDPDNDVALLNLAALELETAQARKDPVQRRSLLHGAVDHAARAAELRPHPRKLYTVAAASVLLAELEPDAAAEHHRRAADAALLGARLARELGLPIEPRWRVIAARALYEADRLPEALQAAQEALQARPADLDMVRLAAHLLGRQGRPAEAVRMLEDAQRTAPDDPLIWLELARAWERAGDTARAREAAREGRARALRTLGARAAELPDWGELVRRGG